VAKAKMSGKATPGAGLCLCGCGAETKPRRRFLQGHDQRLRGMFQRGEISANTTALRAFVAENRNTTARKVTPKATPAKATPVEATPAEATPAEETPADATPAAE
jgi:di/tripeptidase